jgi:hypothetical protein
MSMFQTQYALIDDAWGAPFSPTIENKYKDSAYQAQILNKTEQNPHVAPDNEAVVKRFLNDLYKKEGVDGVVTLLDPAIVRDIRAHHTSLTTTPDPVVHMPELTQEQWLFVLLGIIALIYALDT